MLKVVKFLQIMWLVIAIITFLVATYHLIFTSTEDAIFFYVFSGVALILYIVRKV